MGCVNTSSPEFKFLVKYFTPRERFLAHAFINKYVDENKGKFPDFITLKSMMSNGLNRGKAAVDYSEFYGKVKSMVKTLLPGLSNTEIDQRIKFVDRAEIIRLRDGKDVLSTFIHDTVYLANDIYGKRNEQAFTDVRHEVFHTIFNNFLSLSEQSDVAESFKRWKPQFSNINDKEELEEKIAEAFESYGKISPAKRPNIPTRIKEFFEDILKFLGLMSKGYKDIERLFDDVNNGRFTRGFQNTSLNTRDKTLASQFAEFKDSPELMLHAKSFVVNELNKLLFPEDSKGAVDDDMILNVDKQSTLFKNNKKLFLIKVDKSEALNKLKDKLREMNAQNLGDPQLQRVVQVLNWQGRLKGVFNYLSPYNQARVNPETGEFTLEKSIQEDPNLVDFDEEVNPNALGIGSKSLINPVTKISESVKDFISSITYNTAKVKEDPNFVSIDPGIGFVSLIKLFESLYGAESVEDQLVKIEKNGDTSRFGTQGLAVQEKVSALYRDIIAYDRITLLTKGMNTEELAELEKVIAEAGLNIEKTSTHLIIGLDIKNLNIENVGTNSVDNQVKFEWNRRADNKKSHLLYQGVDPTTKRVFNESNKDFIGRIAKETHLPAFIVAKLFDYNEKRNTLSELTKVAGSLRKISPRFLKHQTLKIKDRETGGTSARSQFILMDSVKDYKSSSSVSGRLRDKLTIPETFNVVAAIVDRYKVLKGKDHADLEIKNLLRSVLVDSDKLGLLTAGDFNRIQDSKIKVLFNNLAKVIDSPVSKNSSEDLEVFLRYTSNFGINIGDYAIEKNALTSFMTSDVNKPKWENQMKTTGYMFLKNLWDFAVGDIKENALLPFLRESKDNYLRYNPMLRFHSDTKTPQVNNGLLQIGKNFLTEFQETFFDNKFSTTFIKKPITFSKESTKDWINRNFLGLYLLPINEDLTANKGQLGYYQQKMQPEGAPNVGLVRMGISSHKEIRNHIASMIVQEVFMNREFQKAGTERNLRENTKSSKVPGLVGSTYWLRDGQNIFFDEEGNIRPKVGSYVHGELVFNTGKNSILGNLIEKVKSDLDESLGRFVKLAVKEKATLDGRQISQMYKSLESHFDGSEYKLSTEENDLLQSIRISDKKDSQTDPLSSEKEAILKKVMSLYYMNSFVNGTFMNQLTSGVTQNYKSPLDEVKRQAGVNAQNDSGLIDNIHGMPTRYNLMSLRPVNEFYGKSNKLTGSKLMEKFFRDTENERADSESYGLPELFNMLRKSMGKSTDIGIVIKGVHYEIEKKGKAWYIKDSTVELTNEYVKKNFGLRDLRFKMTFQKYIDSLPDGERSTSEKRIKELYDKLVDNDGLTNIDEYMEYKDILHAVMDGNFMSHKASFESAIKGVKPIESSVFTKNKESGVYDLNVNDNSVVELNSSFHGIQQAVRHRYIDSFISHFTQLTYLVGLNRTETGIKNNKIITNSLAKLAKAGMYDLLFKYRAFYEDGQLKVNNETKAKFIEDMKNRFDKPGQEKLFDLLDTKGISMNNPLFVEKLMQSLFNTMSKKTVAPKHAGGAFVLTSSFGWEKHKTKNSLRAPEIVTDPKTGEPLYAECYLPAMYSNDLRVGDSVYYDSEMYSKMFGFRIPSSDIHSAVPLKVIGFYPAKGQDNAIVVPSEIVALHGADFDIDKLFVVRYGVFGEEASKTESENFDGKLFKSKFQSKNVVLAQRGIKYGYTAPNTRYDEKFNVTGWGDEQHNEIPDFEKVILSEKKNTQNEILRLDKSEPDTKDMGALQIKTARRAWNDKKKAAQIHLDRLEDIQKGFHSNQIFDAVNDNISYQGENGADMLYGITFEPVKGYDESSEFSRIAKIYSDLNVAKSQKKGAPSPDILLERPKLYDNINDAKKSRYYDEIERRLREEHGVETTTEEGQADLLSLVNEKIKSVWVGERDTFLERQKEGGAGMLNLNKPEQHAQVHKETYMASGLVGLIANYTKAIAYTFHGITDGTNEVKIANPTSITLDGISPNELVVKNDKEVKNQELRSLTLNSALDHIKEQILNALNAGEKTIKIFLTGLSTKLDLHQTTMLMLQPVTKELNSSNVKTAKSALNDMKETITKVWAAKYFTAEVSERDEEVEKKVKDNTTKTKGKEGKKSKEKETKKVKVPQAHYLRERLDTINLTTPDIEKFITMSLDDLINDEENPDYERNLLMQHKVITLLEKLNNMGEEVSKVAFDLSIVKELPYNAENTFDKLDQFHGDGEEGLINVNEFYNKLSYTEDMEYDEEGFKNSIQNKNIFLNVNFANNDNILSALEAIKMQVDLAAELFTENSWQMMFVANKMIEAVSDNTDPKTIFTGDSDFDLNADSVKKLTIEEKYLAGKKGYNTRKIIANSVLNYLTSGLNISYNKAGNLFSMGVRDQELQNTLTNDGETITLGTTRSYLDQFLMDGKDFYTQDKSKRYNGSRYLKSQINPEWRLKPLGLVIEENKAVSNKFLEGISIDLFVKNYTKIITFNSNSVNNQENMAELQRDVAALNNLSNIYVKQDPKTGEWINVSPEDHPSEVDEMGEVIFNILKSSFYSDQFKFNSSRAISVIPPVYFVKLFNSFDNLLRDLFYYRGKNNLGMRYYKDYKSQSSELNSFSAISDIKENLFINTILSQPDILPDIRSKIDFKNNKDSGILGDGSIYDLVINAKEFEKKDPDKEGEEEQTPQIKDDNAPIGDEEVTVDAAEAEAKRSLYDKFKSNPSFVAESEFDKQGRFHVYMKVGQAGDVENGDAMYYYKKIASVNQGIVNTSFDLDYLLNRYRIREHFNSQRLSIPVEINKLETKNGTVELKNVSINSFLTNSSDSDEVSKEYLAEINAERAGLLEKLKKEKGAEFKNLSKNEIRKATRTKVAVRKVIESVKEVALYDKRSIDRAGIKNFRVVSYKISEDKSSIDYVLEALPQNMQIEMKHFSEPFDILKDKDETIKLREAKSNLGSKKETKNVGKVTPKDIDEVINEKEKKCKGE